jgi:hypothetical protein
VAYAIRAALLSVPSIGTFMLAFLAQGLIAPLLAAYLITLAAGLALLLAHPGHSAGEHSNTRIRKSSRESSGKTL